MHVRVDQPGQQGLPAAVDHLEVRRDLDRSADRHHAAITHHHRGLRQHLLAVEHAHVTDREAGGGGRALALAGLRQQEQEAADQRDHRAHGHQGLGQAGHVQAFCQRL